MFVLDSHSDTPSQMMRGQDVGICNNRGHVDFPRLKAGGVDASFFALYTPASMQPDAATRYALEMIGKVYDALEANPGEAALALTPEDAFRNKEKGLVSIFLGMENGAPIQESLSLLRLFHRLGVRYVTLTHNGDNQIADSAAEGARWHGLSPFGREVVAEMNALGMMIDLSHASDQTFWDCIKLSEAPVIATHSSCRALCGHRRNLTDEMLRALGEKEGYVGINFYPFFLSDRYEEGKSWRPGVKEIVDHIDHAVRLAGIDHVGIGSDFDGIEVTPEGVENISQMGVIFDEMRRRGYSENEILKVSGQNLLDVMFRIVNCSK